jgi:hypothetical protein
MVSTGGELSGFCGKLNFFQRLGSLTFIRTGSHISQSEPQEHLTARGFVGGRGRFTIHIGLGGECLGAFPNAGKKLTNKFFDIGKKCERA